MMITVANPIYDSVFKYLMEDEYFTAIENRDTAIMQRDKKIAEQDAQIAEKNGQLAATIKMLIAANVSINDIAVNLNLSDEDVKKISGY